VRPKRSVMCAAKSSRTSGCLTKVNVTMPVLGIEDPGGLRIVILRIWIVPDIIRDFCCFIFLDICIGRAWIW
jgi:hypothetical protein